MKPMDFGGKGHTNMKRVLKWGESTPADVRRRQFRRADANLKKLKRQAIKRGRAAGKVAARGEE